MLRFALAAAVTVAFAATLASLGAASSTTTAATSVVRFVQTGSFAPAAGTTATSSATLTGGSVTSAGTQYVEKVKICHRTSASSSGNTLSVSPSGASNHLAGHEFDYAGPCIS